MTGRVAIAFLGLVCACAFEVSLGPADGVRPFRFEEDIPNPALKKEGGITLTREVEMISEERSRRYLESFGPDKIGALRRVTLTIVDVRIEGANLEMTGPPTLILAGQPLTGQRGASIELEDGQVAWLRARLLSGEPVNTILVLDLQAPLAALDERVPSLHIVVEVQPTLVIDATRAL